MAIPVDTNKKAVLTALHSKNGGTINRTTAISTAAASDLEILITLGHVHEQWLGRSPTYINTTQGEAVFAVS